MMRRKSSINSIPVGFLIMFLLFKYGLDMNLPRVRIDHGDILTFMVRQRFITVVVR